jgi:hypothetical protein
MTPEGIVPFGAAGSKPPPSVGDQPQVHLLHAYDNAPVSARTARAHAALEETPAQPG